MHLISEFLCAESIDSEQLSEDPHTKAKGWNLTLFAWNISRNPDSTVYYARKQRVPCSKENCYDASGISFLRIYRTAIDLAAHGRQNVQFLQEKNLETNFQAEIFFMSLATQELIKHQMLFQSKYCSGHFCLDSQLVPFSPLNLCNL